MKTRLLILTASMLAPFLFATRESTPHEAASGQVVRLAELEIDPAQLENYKTLLREEIAASIRLEPGVLALYSVSIKGQPAHIRMFEIYADMNAYTAHLETAHFKKYKSSTQNMVKSLKLLDTDPILLGVKEK